MLSLNSTFGKSIASNMCRLCALHRKAAGWLDYAAASVTEAEGPRKAGLLRTARVVLAEMDDIETVMASFRQFII